MNKKQYVVIAMAALMLLLSSPFVTGTEVFGNVTCDNLYPTVWYRCSDGNLFHSYEEMFNFYNPQPTPMPTPTLVPTPTPEAVVLVVDNNPQTLTIGTETITLTAASTTTLTVNNNAVDSSWVYVSIPDNFTTQSALSVPVAGLYFTPVNNTHYEVEVDFMVRSPVLAINAPRPGNTWPTGLIDGSSYIQAPALQTVVISNCNIELPCISPIGGLTTTTGSYGGYIKSMFLTGNDVSGVFQVTLASETQGVDVMMMNGSFLKYRVVA